MSRDRGLQAWHRRITERAGAASSTTTSTSARAAVAPRCSRSTCARCARTGCSCSGDIVDSGGCSGLLLARGARAVYQEFLTSPRTARASSTSPATTTYRDAALLRLEPGRRRDPPVAHPRRPRHRPSACYSCTATSSTSRTTTTPRWRVSRDSLPLAPAHQRHRDPPRRPPARPTVLVAVSA